MWTRCGREILHSGKIRVIYPAWTMYLSSARAVILHADDRTAHLGTITGGSGPRNPPADAPKHEQIIGDLGDLAGSIVTFGDRGGLLSGRAAGGNCDGVARRWALSVTGKPRDGGCDDVSKRPV